MLAASMFGSTSRLASPVSVLRGISSLAVAGVERGVAVHLAVDLEPRRLLAQQRQRVAHLHAPTAGCSSRSC